MDLKSLINKFTIYNYIISFLVVLNLVSAFFYGFGIKALLPVLIAVVTTTILDFFIEYFKSKESGMRVSSDIASEASFASHTNSLTTHFFPQSALISGLFIGGLLTQNLAWYIYIIAGAIAILSKHLIKFQQRHIFNPANFGVLLVSIIFGASHTWWISSPLILVLIFGIFIIWRMRRFDLTLSFLISYYLINSAVELARGSNFNDILLTMANGGVIYLFSMYMLIEPKTHPTRNRVYYGILIAVLLIGFDLYAHSFNNILATFFTRHDIPLALAIGNIFVPIFNKLSLEFRKKEATQSQPSV